MSYIYEEVGFNEFCDRLRDYGRENQFSYEGKRALYDLLVEIAEGTGEPYELDIIELCCEFSEGEITEVLRGYNLEVREEEENFEELNDRTLAIDLGEGRVLYQAF